MTTNENFKRRVRARMAKTGERYTAARAALLDEQPARQRSWVSEPEMSDDAVRAATGRGWDEWCEVIERFPSEVDGHGAIAAHLQAHEGTDGWWSQTVTVGYERITGRRLPHQKADGTFSADKSRTIEIDADALRAALLDEDDRADLFGGLVTELRSKPTSKALRISIGPGVAMISITPAAGDPGPRGRTKVSVQHNKLPAYEDVGEWKFFWDDWLDALDAD